MATALTVVDAPTNAEAYRASTDAAGMCREIVMRTAKNISGRKHVSVEGWEAIAIAHGCAASALDVQRVNDEGMSGFKCVGVVRRMSDGQEISRGEGFLGDDEQMWAKRPVYARRAMTQTRAISRACRSAFAHVVVMIDQGLSTTPAEEMGHDPETGEIVDAQPARSGPAPRTKLDGPHTSKTALKRVIDDLRTKVRAAQSVEELDALKTENKQTINQALRDWPELVNGMPDLAEDIGLKGDFENRRIELSGDDGMFAMLVQSMKQAETKLQLEEWLDTNMAIIETLDDVDRRKFEQAKDWHESAILEMDKVTGGA